MARVDGYICSYPKSGRTWLRFTLANLLNNYFQLEMELNLVNQFSLIPNDDNSRSQPEKEVAQFAFNAQRPPLPLIAASHSLWDHRFSSVPVVFLLRRPEDVFVSHYRHLRFHQGRFSGTLEQLFDRPYGGSKHLADYLASWSEHRNDDNLLLVTYEQLRADPLNTLLAIANNFGFSPSEQQLKMAFELSSLEKMRELEELFGIGEPNNYNRLDWRARRVGRAIVGSGRRDLGAEGQKRLQQDLQASRPAWDLLTEHYYSA